MSHPYSCLREGYICFWSLNMVLACTVTVARKAIETNRYFPAAVRNELKDEDVLVREVVVWAQSEHLAHVPGASYSVKNKLETAFLVFQWARLEREHYKTIKAEKRDRAPPLLRPKIHTGGSVAGSVGRVAPRSRRHELLSLWGSSFLHWVNTSHLSSRVESHWCSTELQPVACS